MSVARARATVGAAALLSVLSGCASGEDAAATTAAELGKQIDIRSAGSPTLASLWLDGVKEVTCTEPGSLPANNGRYLAVTIVLQTSEDYKPDWGWWMSAQDFSTTNEDGKETGRGIITSCLPGHRFLPDDFYKPDSGYYGLVLLDSASEHGTLVYRPHNMPDNVPGWHWKY